MLTIRKCYISAPSKNVSAMALKTCNGIVAARQSFGGLGLKMNTGKTQIMICGGRHTLSSINTPQIDIDGERLVCEPVIKDLGVYLDQYNYDVLEAR